MTHQEIREKFITFFKEKKHSEIPSASLVPLNDSTVLFTTAGMHPLIPYLLGQKHPVGARLVNVQKCIRTGDIDEVGDAVHLTFFEMLGNWSLGDYFKKDAIKWSFEFLTDKKWLGIPKERLAFSCFVGDADAVKDEESAELWRSLGVPNEHIVFLSKKDNWWGPAGKTGPCGPDTEMFYWADDAASVPKQFDPDDNRWVEIWNDVFMEYDKTDEGKYLPLKQKNVDTGMGLERTLMALNGKKSVYETELFVPILDFIKKNTITHPTDERHKTFVIADHMRASVFIIADGIEPTNKDRGYVLRRLLRRSIVFAKQLGMPNDWHEKMSHVVVGTLEDAWPELAEQKEKIAFVIATEVKKFVKTLDRGLREFEKLENINGKIAFDLYQTFGFPWELTQEMVRASGQAIDRKEFEKEFNRHKELSRTSSVGQFRGGLADHSDVIIRYHTVTHLMNAALRKILGEHVAQKGSNITSERTRFDFTHPQKMTEDEKKKVEDLVNDWVKRDLLVKKEIMSVQEAQKLGALGAFGEKYGETVSVYTVSDPKTNDAISREFCGGPHVKHTGEIGKFKIIKEESVSAGVRRIRATVE